jgi:hypothetical protein
MFVPALILIMSTALLLFYFQTVCQKILQRRFNQEYFQMIVNANRLEFPSVRRSIEDSGASLEYARLAVMLKRDFMVLTYLLKNANNICQRCTYEERLLILYFRVQFVCLVMRHWLRLQENSAALKLAAILQYFANVVGERINTLRFGNPATSGLLDF